MYASTNHIIDVSIHGLKVCPLLYTTYICITYIYNNNKLWAMNVNISNETLVLFAHVKNAMNYITCVVYSHISCFCLKPSIDKLIKKKK